MQRIVGDDWGPLIASGRSTASGAIVHSAATTSPVKLCIRPCIHQRGSNAVQLPCLVPANVSLMGNRCFERVARPGATAVPRYRSDRHFSLMSSLVANSSVSGRPASNIGPRRRTAAAAYYRVAAILAGCITLFTTYSPI